MLVRLIVPNGFEEVFDSIIIEPYSSIMLTFNPSTINSDVSSLTFNIQPIYHDYDSKIFYNALLRSFGILYHC